MKGLESQKLKKYTVIENFWFVENMFRFTRAMKSEYSIHFF